MESKTADYDPLMSTDARSSLADDSSTSADEVLLGSYQRHRNLMQWAPSTLVGVVFTLILLIIYLLVVVFTQKPTDQQCSAQLSVYCKSTCTLVVFYI